MKGEKYEKGHKEEKQKNEELSAFIAKQKVLHFS